MLSLPPKCVHSKKKKGFSLTEAAVVLGVVGLVIGGIWVAAGAVQENANINRTIDASILAFNKTRELFTVSTIEQLYAPNSCASLNSTILEAGGIPKDFVSGANVLHPWGGAFQARYCYWNPNQRDVGVYLYSPVPGKVCIRFLSAVTSRFSQEVNVASIAYSDGSPAVFFYSFPINMSSLVTACTSHPISYAGFYAKARPN